jgi:hypothetical protein
MKITIDSHELALERAMALRQAFADGYYNQFKPMTGGVDEEVKRRYPLPTGTDDPPYGKTRQPNYVLLRNRMGFEKWQEFSYHPEFPPPEIVLHDCDYSYHGFWKKVEDGSLAPRATVKVLRLRRTGLYAPRHLAGAARQSAEYCPVYEETQA